MNNDIEFQIVDGTMSSAGEPKQVAKSKDLEKCLEKVARISGDLQEVRRLLTEEDTSYLTQKDWMVVHNDLVDIIGELRGCINFLG